MTAADEILIGGRYNVRLDRPMPPVGGCNAYAAHDVSVPGAPLLALAPQTLRARWPEYALYRHGSVIPFQAQEYHDGAIWVICSPLPGPALSAGFTPWPESQLIESVIRPIAELLMHLDSLGMTCRALRPDNVFQEQGSRRLFLGPLGLTPPAVHQPIVFEPLSSAVCAPHQRGDGTIACDVFALGVIILMLCTGKVPLEGLSDEEILQRRFERGSAAVYMAGANIPVGLVSLLQAMLSDTPEYRPAPKDLVTIAPSKMFSSRSRTLARVPLVIEGHQLRTPQAVAWFAARYSDTFLSLLKRRVIGKWLHHELDLVDVARHIERLVVVGGAVGAVSSKTWILMQAVSLLDPTAPLCWGERWFWPQALPQMMANALLQEDESSLRQDVFGFVGLLIGTPDLLNKAQLSPSLKQPLQYFLRLARQSPMKGQEQGRRIVYHANHYQPCLSEQCWEQRIIQSVGLARWLEKRCEGQNSWPNDSLLDKHMRSFLNVHATLGLMRPIVEAPVMGRAVWMSDLQMIARVQQKSDTGSLPNIARKALPHLKEELRAWRSKTLREQKYAQLEQLAQRGDLWALLCFVQDPGDLARDKAQAQDAEREVEAIRAYLGQEAERLNMTQQHARNLGEFCCLLMGIVVAMSSIWYEFCGH
ncbi:serine/threonine-protein kinase [Neokomagataea anthophila]|uniref:Serine/threonine protein kinase n=1 Tax=Neokomagataea anthophila TaxID=2826925 RepID=A0ABS5E5Q1_9PROT|nr:serine/threonine-protein kinase [Neokomagataea anthophila]MBR0558863.1 serine/threonine protein kinase [Neokomagataea anthophila]